MSDLLPSGLFGSSRKRRSRFLLVILVLGVVLATYFSSQTPKDQHVRFVLGNAAPEVTALDCDYENADGVARSANFTFDRGSAPRIVAHEPKLASGDYSLTIRVFSKAGQNTIEKRVTLDEGTVSIDLANALPAPSSVPASSSSPSSSSRSTSQNAPSQTRD